MKRTALVATLALVVVSPVAAHAGGKASRTITTSYSGFYGASSPAVSFNLNCTGGVGNCWQFATVKGEKTVKISAKDSTGTPTALQVFTDGDYQSVQTFCGSGTIEVSPKSGTQIDVRPVADPTCASITTSGTLTAVITKK